LYTRHLRLLAILIVLLSLPTPALSRAAPAPQVHSAAFEPAPCEFELLLTTPEDADIDCGFVQVPLRHAEPDGPQIRLKVAILNATGFEPAPDPLFMAQGGPGGSTIDTYAQLMANAAVRQQRDIVLFDQRGTLYSEPDLLCPETLELTIETLDQRLSPAESAALANEAILACRSRLVAEEGIELSAFDSLENAADVAALQEALGYASINFYGVSYGSLLAFHVMRNHPDSLRSVVVDAVVPPQTNFLLQAASSQQRALNELFAACNADPTCAANYVDLETTFNQVIEQLNVEPARLRLTDPETGITYPAILAGDDFDAAIFQLLYSSEILPLLPLIISDAAAGNFDLLSSLLPLVIFERTIAEGMYLSVICAEDADFDPAEQPTEGMPPNVLENNLRDLEDLLALCALWDVEQLGPPIDEPVTSDIPTLLLSGQFDPITPPANAARAAETLETAYTFTFANGSHGSFGLNPCAGEIIADFLANPQREPRDTCLNQLGPPNFVAVDEVLRISGMLRLVSLEGNTGNELLVYLGNLLFLLTSLIILPIYGLVRLVMKRDYNAPNWPPLLRALPWLTALNALLLFGFSMTVIVQFFSLAATNSALLFVGLPRESWPLLVLPLPAALLGLLMLLGSGWRWAARPRRWPGNLYYSLLSLAALTCIGLLGWWGMLTALF
jgi:pimeloyl-ACP methyl ester carboxylesterase